MIKSLFISSLFACVLVGCSSSTPEAAAPEAKPAEAGSTTATTEAPKEGATATTVAMETCVACKGEFKKEDMKGTECKKCAEAHGH